MKNWIAKGVASEVNAVPTRPARLFRPAYSLDTYLRVLVCGEKGGISFPSLATNEAFEKPDKGVLLTKAVRPR